MVVQGVNIRTKHQKQVQTQAGRNINPGRIQFEGPMDISNVMLVCPKCGEPTRVASSAMKMARTVFAKTARL